MCGGGGEGGGGALTYTSPFATVEDYSDLSNCDIGRNKSMGWKIP